MSDHLAPRLTHLRALDGLRGVAVLAVVLYHFSPGIAPGGFLGVDVFFVLSGFLITSLLVNEWEESRRISLLSFWARRARRLLPALALVLVVIGISALLMANQVDARHNAEDGLAALGYVANWHFIISGQPYVEQLVQHAPSPLRHTWSLAIEEQFYLVWPLIAGAVGWVAASSSSRPGRSRRRLRHGLVAVCLGLGVASFVCMVTLFDPGGDPNRVYYGTDTRAYLLLIGAALGALTAGVPAIARRGPRVLLIALGLVAAIVLGVTMASIAATESWLYEGGYGGIALLIVLVLAAAAQPGRNPLGRVLESRALVGLGLISYGVYLWHWPATVWLTASSTGVDGPALFALRSAFTLAVALASYMLIEQPIRRGRLPRWKTSNPMIAPVAVTTVIACVLLVPVLAFPSVHAVPAAPPSRASSSVTADYASAPRCDRRAQTSPAADRRRPRVQLFGNSYAVEIVPCLRAILERRGGSLETVTQSAQVACTLIPRLREEVDHPSTRPDVAIFFAALFENDGHCGDKPNWLDTVREVVSIWRRAGTHVYLVPLVPNVVPSQDPDANFRGILPSGIEIVVPAQTREFQALAQEDPEHITVVDPGVFLRDANGVYQWRMPCLPGGESGCAEDHTIGVRWTDGSHFCTDPHWNGTTCPKADRGGERRVAAAIASPLLASWREFAGTAKGRSSP